jgi:phosphotransacetylase
MFRAKARESAKGTGLPVVLPDGLAERALRASARLADHYLVQPVAGEGR